MKKGKKVIFAFEEAIGFMWGNAVLDKDGVSAAVQIGTMAAYLDSIGSCLIKKLDEIWDEFGHHVSRNSYYICHQPTVTNQMFERIRNYDGPNTVSINLFFIAKNIFTILLVSVTFIGWKV